MKAIYLLFALLISGTIVKAEDRPNILWITSEDNGPELGCYGDSYAVTPNIDALAAKGMRYTNASSNAPVCAPARSTIISGLYPPSIGSEHMRSITRLPSNFKMFPQFLRAEGIYCTNHHKEDYNLVKAGKVWDASNKRAHWKNRKEGQAFFAVINLEISHESQIRNSINKKDRIHDPLKATVPAYHPDTSKVRKDWAQYYDRVTMMDTQVGQILEELKQDGLEENTIVFYYGDHGSGMPRSKRWLYNSGLQVPLVVYFPEKWKHLAPKDYQASKTSDRLVGFIDLAPTVLSLAGIKPPKWMQGTAFAGTHQKPEPQFSYGFRGRMDERIDLLRAVRDKRYIYIRNYMPHRIYGQYLEYMFKTPTTQVWHRRFQKGKLNEVQSAFWQQKPVEELYDLQADPDEINNLANSAKHQEVMNRMRKAQQDWAYAIKDVGFLPEWEMHQRAGEAAPFEMGHDAKRYDFKAVFAAAELASGRNENDLPAIIKLLKSSDSAVRYWGAVGLLAQGRKGYSAARKELNSAIKDSSPMVQITVAESLGLHGNKKETATALKIVLKYAAPQEDIHLRIAAWNVIDYLDQRALPAIDAIQSLSVEQHHGPKLFKNYARRLKEKTLADLAVH